MTPWGLRFSLSKTLTILLFLERVFQGTHHRRSHVQTGRRNRRTDYGRDGNSRSSRSPNGTARERLSKSATTCDSGTRQGASAKRNRAGRRPGRVFRPQLARPTRATPIRRILLSGDPGVVRGRRAVARQSARTECGAHACQSEQRAVEPAGNGGRS